MGRWLTMMVVLLLAMALLVGCKLDTGSAGLGEGSGVITESDLDVFGRGRAPVDLQYFTAPSEGRYRVTLASGSGQEALRNPWVWVMRGRVSRDRDSFLRAYDQGRGVVVEDSGGAIATLSLRATGGDTFTLVFTSRSDDLGSYNYEISASGRPGPQ